MNGLVSFGTVIRYKEEPYIYLAEISEITYLGKILDPQQTKRLKSFAEDGVRLHKDTNRPAYSFVVLKTPEFKDQAACFADNKGHNATELLYDRMNRELILEDLKEIKTELLKSRSVPTALQDYLNSINLEDGE